MNYANVLESNYYNQKLAKPYPSTFLQTLKISTTRQTPKYYSLPTRNTMTPPPQYPPTHCNAGEELQDTQPERDSKSVPSPKYLDGLMKKLKSNSMAGHGDASARVSTFSRNVRLQTHILYTYVFYDCAPLGRTSSKELLVHALFSFSEHRIKTSQPGNRILHGSRLLKHQLAMLCSVSILIICLSSIWAVSQEEKSQRLPGGFLGGN